MFRKGFIINSIIQLIESRHPDPSNPHFLLFPIQTEHQAPSLQHNLEAHDTTNAASAIPSKTEFNQRDPQLILLPYLGSSSGEVPPQPSSHKEITIRP